eukprot:GHVN01022993.1.p1 GENE.GHVN01022993.1~~GHVN01022993.1.p1  ORF type:complete len:103 (-),score=23.77 GHVN01022993.1:291-599(-)
MECDGLLENVDDVNEGGLPIQGSNKLSKGKDSEVGVERDRLMRRRTVRYCGSGLGLIHSQASLCSTLTSSQHRAWLSTNLPSSVTSSHLCSPYSPNMTHRIV